MEYPQYRTPKYCEYGSIRKYKAPKYSEYSHYSRYKSPKYCESSKYPQYIFPETLYFTPRTGSICAMLRRLSCAPTLLFRGEAHVCVCPYLLPRSLPTPHRHALHSPFEVHTSLHLA
ncbi:unnamed protein product [Laminaria digitata]